MLHVCWNKPSLLASQVCVNYYQNCNLALAWLFKFRLHSTEYDSNSSADEAANPDLIDKINKPIKATR